MLWKPLENYHAALAWRRSRVRVSSGPLSFSSDLQVKRGFTAILFSSPIVIDSLSTAYGGCHGRLGDAFLGVPVPRAVGGGHEPQVCSYRAALLETVGILQGEHEGKRRKCSDPLDLAQEIGLRVALLGDPLQLSI